MEGAGGGGLSRGANCRRGRAASKALALIFADAARRNVAALDAAGENNAAAIRKLRDAGYGVIADGLVERWKELAADLDPLGLPPLPTDSAGGDGQTENLTVPLPARPKPHELDYVARQLLAMIGEKPPMAQRLARIRMQNETALRALKSGRPDLHDEVQAALQHAARGLAIDS